MPFTPDPYLFSNAFGAGLRAGGALRDLVNARRKEGELARLQRLATSGDYNALGGGLIGVGEIGQGLAALGIPAELERAKREERGPFETWMKPEIADTAQGPAWVQFSNLGNARPVKGFTPSQTLRTIDYGTGTALVGNRTGEEIGRIERDVAGKERAEAIGKASGEAQASLPGVGHKVGKILADISRLESHPGLDPAMGMIAGRLPSFLASPLSPQTMQQIEDFRAIKEQVTGDAFLSAFETLKGGGQITEIEGRKATDALIAMRDTQSPEQFRRLLRVFRENVQQGLALAQQRAAQGQSGAPAANANGAAIDWQEYFR